MAIPIDLTQLDSDMLNLIGYDIPKTIILPTLTGTVTVTGLIESITTDNRALFGGLDTEVDTVAHFQKSAISGYISDLMSLKGSQVTADGILKRARSITESPDNVMIQIDLTDPS